jgi:hypothetical protein
MCSSSTRHEKTLLSARKIPNPDRHERQSLHRIAQISIPGRVRLLGMTGGARIPVCMIFHATIGCFSLWRSLRTLGVGPETEDPRSAGLGTDHLVQHAAVSQCQGLVTGQGTGREGQATHLPMPIVRLLDPDPLPRGYAKTRANPTKPSKCSDLLSNIPVTPSFTAKQKERGRTVHAFSERLTLQRAERNPH